MGQLGLAVGDEFIRSFDKLSTLGWQSSNGSTHSVSLFALGLRLQSTRAHYLDGVSMTAPAAHAFNQRKTQTHSTSLWAREANGSHRVWNEHNLCSRVRMLEGEPWIRLKLSRLIVELRFQKAHTMQRVRLLLLGVSFPYPQPSGVQK
jgi:hypothetical protein